MTTIADQGAFEQLLTPVLPAAYRAACHFTGHSADAEDAVQQAALLAWRGFAGFEQGTNFRAWFLRIVTNVCRSEYRRRCRAPSGLSLDDPDHGEELLSAEVTGERSTPTPDVDFLDAIDAAEIQAALAALPEEYRAVATLYFVDDLAYQEIAEIMGCPIGTVRSRLHRGRQLLKVELMALARERGILGSGPQEHPEERVALVA